ncbi:MAG: indolepyruvate ferredoxin oxidoreductase subunit alpha [Firmicutes bacterium]|nr:indolepyruvate ferredoxin oxidoreductase subunit alpha [Bacillota bacterium]
MPEQLVMGNEAIAFGAIKAGVKMVAGYPGTPSTEVLETIAKNNNGNIHVEWSINEKAALEVGAGAAYAGARTLVTMKQVGLNVASDPLMSLNYVGVKGGMVILVADDPGPISSQTEQDTRHYAKFAKMMVFDPSSPKEAYEMIQDAFEYSEKYGEPVFMRPTTRICHGYQTIELSTEAEEREVEGFVKDSDRWVIFPKLSYNNHIKLEKKLVEISEDFNTYRFNTVTGKGTKGIIASGVGYEYVKEVVGDREDIKIFKVATANPFPEKLALEFLEGLDSVLAMEELDPVLEREITYVCGKYNVNAKVYGKLTGHVVNAGELSADKAAESIAEFLGEENVFAANQISAEGAPELPARPPVLCPGCPHRASFYAVKVAMKGKKTRYCGDIGCYTLGNAMPLDMVDTCLCMGAGLTMAQGFAHAEEDVYSFGFIGDSTFFASGMTGVVNAVYNQANITIVLLDNSTTAMTGHQPHPGTGRTMMGDVVNCVDPEMILKGMGVKTVVTADPLDLENAVEVVKKTAEEKGVKAIIFKSPCIAVTKPAQREVIDEDKCINCKKCIKELGCPAIVLKDGKAFIEKSMCFGCSVCETVCPVQAISKAGGDK